MPVSDKNKLIFIHIPKNAGTSITESLDMNSDIGHHLWQHYKMRYPNKWNHYKKFCITRNPWDRVVSCYEYAKLENSYWHSSNGKSKEGKHPDYDLLVNMSFTECVKILKNKPHLLRHHGWSNQHKYVIQNGKLMVDFVLSLENMDEGIKNLGYDPKLITHVNKSNNKKYKTYYTEETKNIVNEVYKKDIEYFNYSY